MPQPQQPPAPEHAASLWPLVHAERAALAADLAGLTDQQWQTQSLCTGLTVHEVLAHLTAGASLNPLRWLAGVIRCRFDFGLVLESRGSWSPCVMVRPSGTA
jgi:hypothetical protein